MPILHLGVVDIFYADAPKGKKAKGKVKGVTSTGDVAEILEAKYHVMESFYELHKEDIAKDILKSVKGAVENIFAGAPLTIDPFGRATSKMKRRFSKFLSQGEMEKIGFPGVPTAASGKTSKRKGGINHRLKHPYAKNNPERPSFIDTGLYEVSFKSWID